MPLAYSAGDLSVAKMGNIASLHVKLYSVPIINAHDNPGILDQNYDF